jgi:hypothetical protein
MKKENQTKKPNIGGQPGNKNAEKWPEEKALKIAAGLIRWLRPKKQILKDGKTIDAHAANIFYEEYIVIIKGLYPDFIGNMCEKFNSFSDLIKKAKAIQKIKLMKHSTAGNLKEGITCFILKNYHGMADKVEFRGNIGNRPYYDYSKLTDKELTEMEKLLKKAEATK